ncbi:RNA-directed DNA polymerase from mobile element jockey [Trichonephila clavipes]|nr:RNA-directed DNA polymerase from mobile element jockey [Trichonephila clavipes]
MNKLQKQIKHDLKLLNRKEWDDILEEANFDPSKLHNIIKRKRTQQITYPPLLGYRGMIYDTLDKANLFADTMEESFKENSEPYDDEHIEMVERQVHRYMRNISFSTPPLTSPEEVCNIILGLENTKRTCEHNNIIPNFQHSFRENTATNHQLVRLTNLVVSGFNNRETTGGAFLDVEKAFDRVWHDGLLLKLIELNFPPYIIMIINNYLRYRSFQIRISATLSRTAYTSAGYPQGSLLSPLLYNIFTHDFPTAPTVHICLFAADAAIISQACSPDIVIINLQKYLKKLLVWLTKWRIKINVSKSQAIIFKRGHYKNRMQCLKLFRTNIPWTANIEYLGVTLDSKLTFKNHLTKITCKFKITLMTLLPLLNKNSNLSRNSKRLIYLQYLQPILTYTCQIWGYVAITSINKLQVHQNIDLRIILNYPQYIARKYLHNDANLQPLNERIRTLAERFLTTRSALILIRQSPLKPMQLH